MNNIIEKIKSIFPDDTVYTIINYDLKHYLVEAGDQEFADVYAIDKNTYDVLDYSVADDLNKFQEALKNRTIYKVR